MTITDCEIILCHSANNVVDGWSPPHTHGMMVEFSLHVKTDYFSNAEEIMVERNLLQRIIHQEGFESRRVGFLYQDDPKHWIVCSHKPGVDAADPFRVSAMPKRHYSIENAKETLRCSLLGT